VADTEHPFERIITLTIDEADLAAAEAATARRLAGEVKIKGFRPGKAPRQVVEGVVGSETLRREAIDDALPALVADAITAGDLQPALLPRMADMRDVDGVVEVDVRITLWPTMDVLPDYRGRRIEVDVPDVDDGDVDAQIERMRDQFAELEDVTREGFDGDYVLVDVNTTRNGEAVDQGTASDMLYEIGTEAFVPGMDDALRGKGAGTIAQFDVDLPPGTEEETVPMTVRVLVKQVKAKRLPELSDEWVDDVSEFDTIEEMRTVLAEQLGMVRLGAVREQFERLLLTELVEDSTLDLPPGLVEAEMESVLHRFAHRLEAQGIDVEQYLALSGQENETFVADLRGQADLNLKTRVLLETVASAEDIAIEDGEIDRTVVALAQASQMPVDEYRQALDEGEGEEALAGDILRRKTIDRLLEQAVPVDADGNEIDFPEEIESPAPGGEAAAAAAVESGGDGAADGGAVTSADEDDADEDDAAAGTQGDADAAEG